MVACNLLPDRTTPMMKPNKIKTNFEKFPGALAPLCEVEHWVVWRWEQ